MSVFLGLLIGLGVAYVRSKFFFGKKAWKYVTLFGADIGAISFLLAKVPDWVQGIKDQSDLFVSYYVSYFSCLILFSIIKGYLRNKVYSSTLSNEEKVGYIGMYSSYFQTQSAGDKVFNQKAARIEELILNNCIDDLERDNYIEQFTRFSEVASTLISDALNATVEESEEKRKALVKQKLEKSLGAFVRSVLCEGKPSIFRAALFVLENESANELSHYVDFQEKHATQSFSGGPLNINRTFGGFCFKNDDVLVFPEDYKPDIHPHEDRDSDGDGRYSVFSCAPIKGIGLAVFESNDQANALKILKEKRLQVILFTRFLKNFFEITDIYDRIKGDK